MFRRLITTVCKRRGSFLPLSFKGLELGVKCSLVTSLELFRIDGIS